MLLKILIRKSWFIVFFLTLVTVISSVKAIEGVWEEIPAGSATSPSGISGVGGSSQFPQIVFSPTTGEPYVAWAESVTPNTGIYVRRFDGSSWINIGANPISGFFNNFSGGAVIPQLDFTTNGTPYVAWTDNSTGNQEIYIRSFDGANWVEVGVGSASGGGISNNAQASMFPSLAIAPDNTPYLAWWDYLGTAYELHVRRFNGTNWVDVGAGVIYSFMSVASSFIIPSIDIAVDGTPYVAWGDGALKALRFDGVNWVDVGVGSSTTGIGTVSLPRPPDLLLYGNTPYITWEDSSNEIYVLRFDGTNWVEVGVGSASAGGISSNVTPSSFPSIAVSASGTLYVAWNDFSTSIASDQIYVRYFDGTTWAEIPLGSASGNGISNSGGVAETPTIAISTAGIPYVVWANAGSPTGRSVFVRRFIETLPSTLPPAVNNSAITLFDPAISKIGFLLPGQVGVTGEQVEWVITVVNNGAQAGTNVVISDTLRPELRLDRIETSRGTATLSEQTAVVNIPFLNPGESVQISLFTTVLSGVSVENIACLRADNLSAPRCATGQLVRSLPTTGEKPLWREQLWFALFVMISGWMGRRFLQSKH